MQDLHFLPRTAGSITLPKVRRPLFVNEVARTPVVAIAPADIVPAEKRPRILARRAARWARRDAR